jgi:hypothetical protein
MIFPPQRQGITTMSQIVFATVDGDYLKPDAAIGLAQGAKVRLTVEPFEEGTAEASSACDVLDELCEQFPVDSQGDRLTRDQLHERG